MNILIILSYVENSNNSFVKELVKKSEYIICADGGQIFAKNHNIYPDLCVGDFDSTSELNIDNKDTNNIKNYRLFNSEYVTYPSEKNLTDAEASIKEAIDRFNNKKLDITLLGGIGGRLDHTLGAINTIRKYSSKNIKIRLVDMKNTAEFISSKANNTILLPYSKNYKYFSIIPYDEVAIGVTIKGAKYNLDDYDLTRAGTLGISNEVLDKNDKIATVTISDGDLLIIRSND